ncbi:glycosyltransferase family 2 protein [Hydrogenovibrio thermophilus]|uniref:Beta-monoglucosyldiacylglycerol synthase n=1 Tax=Hydrogenovibrio thermophilus TaxID=265883 RepID=A0A410H362_9GAMM|nr:glycosyltransferase family 2 protein [Hydrogenovibrio thermophilus]QAB15362.1 glycosyltransferase [Hydrogenovibrio thermophilus]
MQNLLILLSFALFTFGSYAYFNKPLEEPSWPTTIPGFAFSPYHYDQSPFSGIYPTTESIEKDLEILSGMVHAIRTYSATGVFGEIPELAAKHNINLALGAWIDGDFETNEQELKALEEIVHRPPYNVVRAIVGNEAVLRKEISVDQMSAYLERMQKALDVPVSTAEPWHVWMKYPELAEHADYLAVHMLPFWEGVPVESAVDYIVDKMALLSENFPNKPIVIAEVGWPSNGRSIKEASASNANEAIFLRRFLDKARTEGYVYYVMEAFDQPWKADLEGAVGAYWGVYDVNRQPKFEFYKPIIPIKEWRILAIASILLAVFLVLFLLMDSRNLKKRGRTFLVAIAFFASSVIIWVVYQHTLLYQDWISRMVGLLLMLGVMGVWLVILVEAHEWAEALWLRKHRRLLLPSSLPETTSTSRDWPFISVHVPAYNEPPDMMIETLDALSRLDYPSFEVLVIDNNTQNENVWRPVQQHCKKLGTRFRFFHVSPLEGFKAGALNFALKHTHTEAEAIAVIDSDYQVESDWLKRLVVHFDEPEVAIVQAPQDYRDFNENAFKAMCYAEYKGFFHIGMVTRNERNAIIQHGTMTLVRRKVLQEVGGWGETTITEDAELGLKIFEHGYQATYESTSYGRGVMPDTFMDYKKQRYRWAYGAMQIMREHAGALFLNQTHLNLGQRYHFIAGWLPWIADGFNFIFTLLAIIWSLLMISNPIHFNAPNIMISLVPILFFGFKLLKMLALYLTRMHASFVTATGAAVAGLALSHTIAKAVLSGLFIGRKVPFLRTPKGRQSAAILQALKDAGQETALVTILASLVLVIYWRVGFESLETLFWCIVLGVQMMPYLAAVILSTISAFPSVSARWLRFNSVTTG